MRGLLVLIGILAAALIGVTLALPRLVDEPALRARLLAAASEATGRPVESAGGARLELLPWPRLSLDRVRLQGPGPFRLEADRIDVDLALEALVRGRFDPRRLQLVRPRIEVERLPADPLATVLGALGRGVGAVRELQVIDGTVILAAAPGGEDAPRELRGADLALRFDAERRRMSAQGAGELEGEPLRLDATLEPVPLAGPASLRLDLAAGRAETAVAAAFQGSLQGADGRLAGRLRLSAPRGRLPGWLARLAGSEAVAALPGGFELTGDLVLDAGKLALDGLEVGLAGTRARGRAQAAWRDAPRIEATLEAAQATVTPELEAALRWLALTAPAAGRMSGHLELRLASLAWRGGEIRRLRAILELAAGRRLSVPRLDAMLPGTTELRWIGSDSGDGEGVTGALALQAGELRALLAWLGVPAGELPAAGLTSLDLQAQAEISGELFRLTALEARLDATLLAGSLALRRGVRPRLEAALAVDRLNTALYLDEQPGPSLAAWRRRLAELDASLDLTVERLSHDAWRDGKLVLRGTAEAGKVELADFRLTGEGGASLVARGTADLALPAYDVTGELASGGSDRLIRMLGVPPGPGLAGLLPVSLSGRLQGDPEAAGVEARLRAGGVTGELHGSLGGPFDPSLLDLAGELTLPDPAALVAAFGWPSPAGAGMGGIGATFELSRDGGPLHVAAKGRLAAGGLQARLDLALSSPFTVALALDARSLETAAMARTYDFLASPLGVPAGWPWEWPGAWPRQPLAWDWLDGPDLRLDLAAAELRHEGAVLLGAGAAVSRRAGRLTLTDLDLPLAGGRLEGTLTLERETDHALLSGDLRLKDARAEELAGLLAPGSGLAGRLDLSARLLARGQSVADFARSLEGEGELALRDGSMAGVSFPPGAGPAPLEPVLTGLRLWGPLRATRGVVASGAPGLELTYGSGGVGRAELRFDLLAWLLELDLTATEPEPAALRLIGAPGRLRPVPSLAPP